MRKNKLCAYLHFVWATWDRHPWITEEVEERLYRYIGQVCQDDGCDLLAIGGMPDHVHLLVSFPNTLTFADFMQHVKGGSSRFLTQMLKPGQPFQWQGSYGVFSVSTHDLEKVIHYITHQKEHHAEDRLWPEYENAGEEVILKHNT